MKGIIQNDKKGMGVNDENRPPTSILRYKAGQLQSDGVSDSVFRENK